MIGTVYHTGYLTDDLDKAIAFYQAAFDAQVLGRPRSTTGENVFLKVGDTEVEIICPADKTALGGRTGLILDHVGYFVPDLEQALIEMEKRGFKRGRPVFTTALGYRIGYLDTESTLGTKIHLTEKPRT